MRRHRALIPLSHDHHHALAQARRLEQAADENLDGRRRAADDFLNFYLVRGLRHFREEEELFLPPLIESEANRDLVVRVVLEHLQLHGLIHELKHQLSASEAEPDVLRRIGKLLVAHVRFEEKEVFPRIETSVPEEKLAELAGATRRDL